MADPEAKSEISKEVLAPVDGIREDLVSTAVKFLQNPKVTTSPVNQKKAFLQRKGLTNEEIEAAIERSGVSQTPGPQPSSPSSHAGPQPHSVLGQQGAMVPAYTPQSELSSRWVKTRDVLAVITMFTGISYAAYKLYQEFLRPWLFGIPTSDKRLAALEKMVTESMSRMTTSLSTIENTLSRQQEKLQVLSHDINSKTGGEGYNSQQNNLSIIEIKTELTSIKGLLLNRRQFPPVPTSNPVLPSWQLANNVTNSGDANSNEKGDQEAMETSPKITLSTSPAPESPTQVSMETEKDNKDELEMLSAVSEDKMAANVTENEAESLKSEAEIQSEAEVSTIEKKEASDSESSLD